MYVCTYGMSPRCHDTRASINHDEICYDYLFLINHLVLLSNKGMIHLLAISVIALKHTTYVFINWSCFCLFVIKWLNAIALPHVFTHHDRSSFSMLYRLYIYICRCSLLVFIIRLFTFFWSGFYIYLFNISIYFLRVVEFSVSFERLIVNDPILVFFVFWWNVSILHPLNYVCILHKIIFCVWSRFSTDERVFIQTGCFHLFYAFLDLYEKQVNKVMSIRILITNFHGLCLVFYDIPTYERWN